MNSKIPRRFLIIVLPTALVILAILTAVSIISYQNTIHPSGIIIHHSAIPRPLGDTPFSIELIDQIHQKRGYGIFYWGKTYHIGYHYVIFPDGTLQTGRPETCRGSHTLGKNEMIGICLIGDFSDSGKSLPESFQPDRPTDAQMKTLNNLFNDLKNRHYFNKNDIHQHRDFNDNTECPGRNFPMQEFLNGLDFE